MKQKVTIEDVAKHCGVSKSSVSRYLNQGYVSEKSKEKIAKAIEELGFERDFFASRLKAKNNRMIGIIASRINENDNAHILEGMQRQWNAFDYQGVLLFSDCDSNKEMECLKRFYAQGVDGVIFLNCDNPENVKDFVIQKQMKVLFANHTCLYAPFLDVEERRGGEILGSYCVSQDMERILSVIVDKEKGAKRERGFHKAYENAAKSCTYEMVEIQSPVDAYQQAKHWIHCDFDVIICENEIIALAILKYFHEVFVHVPQNISIICFGNREISSFSYPSLTTMTCDYAAFGSNLVEEMIAMIEMRAPKWKDVSWKLSEKESTRSH